MKKRLILLAGLGIGFVLGSRAGRQSYEKLKAQVEEWWQDPRVRDSVSKATETVKEQAPIVADKVQSAAGSAVGAAQDKVSDVKSGREQKKAEKGAEAHDLDLEDKKDAEARAAAAATPAGGSVADPSPAAQQDTGVQAGSDTTPGGSVANPSPAAQQDTARRATGTTAGTTSDAVILDDSISDPQTALESEGPTTRNTR